MPVVPAMPAQQSGLFPRPVTIPMRVLAVQRPTDARSGRSLMPEPAAPLFAGSDTHALVGVFERLGAHASFKRHAELFGESESADFAYCLVSGTLRTYKLLADGRRQIGAFCGPGDLLGLRVGCSHSTSASAVTDVSVLVLKRRTLFDLATNDPAVAQHLWYHVGQELERLQNRLVVLIKTADERVAGFLLEMGHFYASGSQIEIRMPRQDIADYLGLTIETVCRILRRFEASSMITLPTSRTVILRNRSALESLDKGRDGAEGRERADSPHRSRRNDSRDNQT
jgi:CRP/FNR family nitrogen fixation transcriptional regulator